ncbi:hypothetical protein HanXRQr2_Chr10g0419671 [Helianthus annuus]|uniref:Uncharacterized protein n=1 Tax=Helianthus annuus TaxID=4232 RepID=A0A251TEQ7_HELAN|nr:hypothetical protein HanXRQr2_Chr10g0419671 [Helianthus annuus]KAJ0512358.1 hypothetical protein HanHA300_Chr10g0345341 [Helianthus annuus]KAJ0528458.1 hypothetical protein HanHA89_Chr10g0366641 [Helianthus annuus]KAJ0803501.1 hypothetical protein HanLR1_Chr00c1813g0821551 [Helianthus annuus]KAJ0882106.1 hypothetical protein HanPSC8_Chr10g0405821 [Helianthus annuus]
MSYSFSPLFLSSLASELTSSCLVVAASSPTTRFYSDKAFFRQLEEGKDLEMMDTNRGVNSPEMMDTN